MKKIIKELIKPAYIFVKNYYLYLRKILDDRRQFVFFKKVIGSNKLVFDVGANVGRKTELFNKLKNKVVAVEPQSYCYEILKEKFQNNPDIMIVNRAVSDKTGEAVLYVSSKYAGSFSTLTKGWFKDTKYDSFDKREAIKLTTLENLITEYGLPYFCKIDVEGFELQVFNGLRSKIPCLNFEYHLNLFDQISKCLNRLTDLGYKSFNYVEGEGNFELKNWVSAVNLANILNKKSKINNQIWGDIYAK